MFISYLYMWLYCFTLARTNEAPTTFDIRAYCVIELKMNHVNVCDSISDRPTIQV